jgi:hypothetical protein
MVSAGWSLRAGLEPLSVEVENEDSFAKRSLLEAVSLPRSLVMAPQMQPWLVSTMA